MTESTAAPELPVPEFPPVVYVPARPAGDQLEVEMQLMTDGRRGLFAYSAIDRLRDLYPGAKAWLALTVEGLQSLHDESDRPYELLFLDRAPHVVGDEGSAGG